VLRLRRRVPPFPLKGDAPLLELILGITDDVFGKMELDDVLGKMELDEDVFGKMELDEDELGNQEFEDDELGNQELEGLRLYI